MIRLADADCLFDAIRDIRRARVAAAEGNLADALRSAMEAARSHALAFAFTKRARWASYERVDRALRGLRIFIAAGFAHKVTGDVGTCQPNEVA